METKKEESKEKVRRGRSASKGAKNQKKVEVEKVEPIEIDSQEKEPEKKAKSPTKVEKSKPKITQAKKETKKEPAKQEEKITTTKETIKDVEMVEDTKLPTQILMKGSEPKFSLSDRNYDPIQDAPFMKNSLIPFEFVSSALTEIEIQKGEKSKDVIKEIISNVFRTAIVLSPSELVSLFYFFIVKLAPDYIGNETGVGDGLLLKAVAKASGRSDKMIRESLVKCGDLGTVAKDSKGT